MAVAHAGLGAGRREKLGRVLAHRLEHREPGLGTAGLRSDEGGIQQIVERGGHVDAVAGDRLDG